MSQNSVAQISFDTGFAASKVDKFMEHLGHTFAVSLAKYSPYHFAANSLHLKKSRARNTGISIKLLRSSD